MTTFVVTLTDQTTHEIDGADAYRQEGPLTTFFRLDEGRRVIDSWSIRLASFRTTDIGAIRRRATPRSTVSASTNEEHLVAA
jgi:hypothetical protein